MMSSPFYLLLLVHVVSSTIYHVDPNPEKTAERRVPFQTIQACVDALQTPGDECHIAPGRYHENVEISNKHGTPNKPFVIRGTGDALPVIDGTVPLSPSTWSRYKDGIFKATIRESISQLFVDGIMMTNARWPNALWSDKTVFNASYWAKSALTSTPAEMIDDGSKDLAGSGLNATGAMAILNIGSFDTFTAVVEKHSPGSDKFTYNDTFGNIHFKASHNQYFLEDKLEFLDQPEEWFYDVTSSTLYVWTRDGENPDGHDVRGKVQTYAFNITNCTDVVFDHMTFFATTLWASSIGPDNLIDRLAFRSLNFSFPSYSRRMLRDTDPPHRTTVNALIKKKHQSIMGTLTFFNNTFYGTDGVALEYAGANITVENNLFEYNDWSAANMKTASGGLGTIISQGAGDVFVRNTLRFNGASAGYRPGLKATVRLNHFHHQCWGLIQNDGSSVQTTTGSQTNALLENNWAHSSPKLGLRFDGQPPKVGHHGTIRANVVWNCSGIMVKGDDHTVLNNLAFDKRKSRGGDHQDKDCTLCVLRYVRKNPVPINNNTVVEFNGADVGNGGKHGGKVYPLAGKTVKYNVLGDVRKQVVDADNMDFRPLLNSTYMKYGAGPYSYNPSKYWIPGRQLYKASTPVPPDGSKTVKADRRALMWLNGYGAERHQVYLGTDAEEVAEATPSSPQHVAEIDGEDNVCYLPGHTIEPAMTYYWRVDAEVKEDEVFKGDVWSFSTVH